MKVVHQLPGRVRLELPELQSRPELSFHLKQRLLLNAGIAQVQINQLSARILINYSPRLLTLGTIIKQIMVALADLTAANRSLLPRTKVTTSPQPSQVFELESLPIVRQLFWTAAASVLFLYVNAKHHSPAKRSSQAIRNLDTLLTVLCGYPIFKTASDHLFQKGHLSTEFLASVASFASIAIEENRLGSFINLIVYLSTLLRTTAAEYTRDKIQSILAGRQTKARLATPKGTQMISAQQLEPGNKVIIKTGERVPADGQVIKGAAVISAYLPRGSVIPEKLAAGQKVYAGSTVQQGEITVLAQQVGSTTYIGRVLQMLQNGSCKSHLSHKAVMKLMHKVSLSSLTIATGVYLVTGDSHRAITMLIVGAPGAAGLASSMALGTAAGQAACHGILAKDDRHIEMVGKADTLLFNRLPKSKQVSKETLKALRQAQVSLVGLLDNKVPQQKADIIHHLQCQGRRVAVIGDINEDVLALARADVGIASSNGDNLTLQEAEILVIGQADDRIPWFKILARDSINIARQNTILSLGTNIVGLTLGLANYLSPLTMAILQNISTFGILFNSGRLLLPSVVGDNGNAKVMP